MKTRLALALTTAILGTSALANSDKEYEFKIDDVQEVKCFANGDITLYAMTDNFDRLTSSYIKMHDLLSNKEIKHQGDTCVLTSNPEGVSIELYSRFLRNTGDSSKVNQKVEKARELNNLFKQVKSL